MEENTLQNRQDGVSCDDRIAALADISAIPVDPMTPPSERVRRFVSEVGDPYRFRVDKTPVRVYFEAGAPSLQARLLSAAQAIPDNPG